MSDSVRPHRQQPTRLPCPWDSPGKNTGVGCHFLLQCMKVKSESEVAQSCPSLSDPMDCSLPGSSVHVIFQARVHGTRLIYNKVETRQIPSIPLPTICIAPPHYQHHSPGWYFFFFNQGWNYMMHIITQNWKFTQKFKCTITYIHHYSIQSLFSVP